MELHKAVIHELIKEPARDGNPAIEAHLEESEQLLDAETEATISLVESIQSLYGTKGNSSSQGRFDFDGGYTFPAQLNEYIDSNGDDDSFLEMSLNAMANLVRESASQNFATGGYIVFAFFTQNGEDFVLAAMVKKRDGITLKNLVPETVQEVDLSKLHQAIKINISRYLLILEAEDRENVDAHATYLSFISPKANSSASGYFISAFGCSDAIPVGILTKNAISAVKSFFSEDERLEHLASRAYDNVVGYLEETLRRDDPSCSLDELNHLVNAIIPPELSDELADSFSVYANQEPYFLPENFYTNSSEVKKAKRVSLKGLEGAWSLNVEKRFLGESINDDIQFIDSGSRSEIRIRNLSDKIIEQLREVMSDRG